jgi:hypothetical protein
MRAVSWFSVRWPAGRFDCSAIRAISSYQAPMITTHVAAAFVISLLAIPPQAAQAPASAPAQPKIAPLWTWHTEEVEPADVPRYEAAIANIARAQREAKVPMEVTGWYAIEVGLGLYINIAPLGSYAELDRQPERRAELARLVPDLPKLQDPLHGSLRTHHTKVLRHLADTSYLPAKPLMKQPVPGYLRIVLEWPRLDLSALPVDAPVWIAR